METHVSWRADQAVRRAVKGSFEKWVQRVGERRVQSCAEEVGGAGRRVR